MLPCIDWDYDAKTRTKTFASSKLTQALRERELVKEKMNPNCKCIMCQNIDNEEIGGEG